MSSPYRDTLINACRAAGNAILSIYDSPDFGIELKGDNSPLTRADKAGHEAIMQYLSKTGLPVLSEEGKDISYSDRRHWNEFWMVDPLDGTKEFIKRNGEFTVNIALIRNGEPVYGAVYVPVTKELFIGGESEPAVKIVGEKVTPLQAQSGDSFHDLIAKEGLRVVASRSHLNDDTKAFVDSLDSPEIVSMGSSLKFLALADQKADVYPRFAPTMEWDTAAAHAVMLSLGYHVENQEGKELCYNKENFLNPYFICY